VEFASRTCVKVAVLRKEIPKFRDWFEKKKLDESTKVRKKRKSRIERVSNRRSRHRKRGWGKGGAYPVKILKTTGKRLTRGREEPNLKRGSQVGSSLGKVARKLRKAVERRKKKSPAIFLEKKDEREGRGKKKKIPVVWKKETHVVHKKLTRGDASTGAKKRGGKERTVTLSPLLGEKMKQRKALYLHKEAERRNKRRGPAKSLEGGGSNTV